MTRSPARRAVLALSGRDRVTFLQGLVTNDVALLGSECPMIWSALLTPQGRWLSSFFLYTDADRILLDCAADHADMLIHRLSRFRLRSDIRLERTELSVLTGEPARFTPKSAIIAAPDPRCAGAGWRTLVPASDTADGETPQNYLARRLVLGLPDCEDFVAEQTLALEANMDLLHGVSWTKGCYMGQELTARTHYRGLLRKRLLPVRLQDGNFTPEDTEIMLDGKAVGDIRSRQGDRALTMLRREGWASDRLTCAGKHVRIEWPEWFVQEMRA